MGDEKRFEMVEVDGLWLSPNACSRCGKWFPPYMAAIPHDDAGAYCWGHQLDDAVEPWRTFVQHLADLPIGDGPHVEDVCGCPVHQAQRFLREQLAASFQTGGNQ